MSTNSAKGKRFRFGILKQRIEKNSKVICLNLDEQHFDSKIVVAKL